MGTVKQVADPVRTREPDQASVMLRAAQRKGHRDLPDSVLHA
jgi:hypothetical protein